MDFNDKYADMSEEDEDRIISEMLQERGYTETPDPNSIPAELLPD